jgi:hypothetical protein
VSRSTSAFHSSVGIGSTPWRRAVVALPALGGGMGSRPDGLNACRIGIAFLPRECAHIEHIKGMKTAGRSRYSGRRGEVILNSSKSHITSLPANFQPRPD